MLSWWCRTSPFKNYDAVICDGAVRSGKTLCMTLSFVSWAFYAFNATAFALCGKTVTSLKRNIVDPILPLLKELNFECSEKLSKNYIDISLNGRSNRFYLFGGKDEASASLIQGMTLGGVLLDEVALMPRSFVEQALARCSVEGSKMWFNCNPENPMHWFHEEWIKKAEKKNCLYLHFKMEDNPSLSPAVMKRYKNLYSGAFYERFVEGKWVAVSGCVYPMFHEGVHVKPPACAAGTQYISCDYGTVNPSSFGLWRQCGGIWHRVREYYYDSRREGAQKTDEEHYASLEELANGENIEAVIVDPSAASFIECIKRHGKYKVIKAKNDVVDGIRKVQDALREKRIMISPECADTIREFGLYRWEENSGKDLPRKENDHAMDDIRYFVTAVLDSAGDGFFSVTVER